MAAVLTQDDYDEIVARILAGMNSTPPAANVTRINDTSIAGTSTHVAEAFLKMFNVANPVGTVNNLAKESTAEAARVAAEAVADMQTGGVFKTTALAPIDTALTASHGTGIWGPQPVGGVVKTVQIFDTTGNPVPGASVYSSSDSVMKNIIAGPFISSAQGIATCVLPLGAQYLWALSSGYTIANPLSITVT